MPADADGRDDLTPGEAARASTAAVSGIDADPSMPSLYFHFHDQKSSERSTRSA